MAGLNSLKSAAGKGSNSGFIPGNYTTDLENIRLLEKFYNLIKSNEKQTGRFIRICEGFEKMQPLTTQILLTMTDVGIVGYENDIDMILYVFDNLDCVFYKMRNEGDENKAYILAQIVVGVSKRYNQKNAVLKLVHYINNNLMADAPNTLAALMAGKSIEEVIEAVNEENPVPEGNY